MDEPAEHQMTLIYFNSDDGVYLLCSCHFTRNLGFQATPADAVAAESEHLRSVRNATPEGSPPV